MFLLVRAQRAFMTVVNVTEKRSETFSASSNRQILFPKHTTRETSFVSLFEVCVCVCVWGGGGGGGHTYE